MQLVYGNYSFPVNACGCTTTTRAVTSTSGRPVRNTVMVVVRGTLFALGQAALTAQELLLRAALATPYRNLILKQDSGLPSSVRLIDGDALGGVVVVDGPNFTEDTGSEFTTTRKFTFTARAEFVYPGDNLIAYQDSISIQGNGGPVRSFRVPKNAGPIRQVVTPMSVVRLVHAGFAVGHLSRPDPPEPAFGREALLNESESITEELPTPSGINWFNFPVRWNYVGETCGGRGTKVRMVRPKF